MYANRRRVIIRDDGDRYAVEPHPNGVLRRFQYFAAALRAAAGQAEDWHCDIDFQCAAKPVAGDLGPVHLLEGHRVWCVAAEGGGWEVLVYPRIWGAPNCNRLFLQLDAEPAARRYADRLVRMICGLAKEREAHLQRKARLQRRERTSFVRARS